jgi:dihydropteroate synthase
MISELQKPFHSINCSGKLLDLNKPKIMGILNLTPDSFSDGGKFFNEKSALKQVEKMICEGAYFVDIGAQSTRPKAEFLSAETEIERLGNVISTIKKEFPEVLISLDTFYADVVNFGFNEGIDLVNDISAGQYDSQLLETVGKLKLPYVLMHNHSDYSKMHEKIEHQDLVLTLNYFFSEKILELQSYGIDDYFLDPGFGFGKTAEQQFKLIDELEYLNFGKNPLLIGISRKSFIYKSLNKTPLEINEETEKLHLKCLEKGAKILRVHDVAEARKTIAIFEKD